LQQFLQHASEYCPGLQKVLQLSAYNSHEIHDEFITTMYRKCMNTLLDQIKSSKYFSIAVDEKQDILYAEKNN